ncbi:MAG: TetR/AcrR family transcriptional regulator [Candidatus Riflebacteria bacterium]|nr:TetR/AcrR family transcriptional regulator [Candidatus Riflebacteria bacterium]
MDPELDIRGAGGYHPLLESSEKEMFVSTPKQAERLQRILETALVEFSRAGFAEGSLDRIARESGVAKTTIYRHFTNKEGLFQAVFQVALDRLSRVIRVPPGRRGFEERLRHGLRNLLREVERDPAIFLVFRTIGPNSSVPDPDLNRELMDAYMARGEWVIQELRTAQSQGLVRRDLDPERFYMVLLAMVHSQVYLRIRRGKGFTLGKSAELIGDILFQGIGPAGPRARAGR